MQLRIGAQNYFFLSPLIIAKILSIRMKWRCLLPNLKGFLRVKLLTQWFIDIVQHQHSFYQLYVSFHATEGNWKFHGNEISNFKRLKTPRYTTRIQDSIGFRSKLASERLLNDCFEYHNYPVCCCMVDHDWAWITAIYKTDRRSIIRPYSKHIWEVSSLRSMACYSSILKGTSLQYEAWSRISPYDFYSFIDYND